MREAQRKHLRLKRIGFSHAIAAKSNDPESKRVAPYQLAAENNDAIQAQEVATQVLEGRLGGLEK
jgi:hypothetical protein